MASPEKITITKLKRILESLIEGSKDSIGNYLYKGLHFQISEYGFSNAERAKRSYHKKRNQGLCVVCGKKVKITNRRTQAYVEVAFQASGEGLLDLLEGSPSLVAVKRRACFLSRRHLPVAAFRWI